MGRLRRHGTTRNTSEYSRRGEKDVALGSRGRSQGMETPYWRSRVTLVEDIVCWVIDLVVSFILFRSSGLPLPYLYLS
jgi:hypothetical protein